MSRPFFVYGTLMKGFRNQVKCLPTAVIEHISVGCFAPERGVCLTHFPGGYPGMYYCRDEDSPAAVVGEIVLVKEKHVDNAVKVLDALEEYYGPEDPRNRYYRETVLVRDEATQETISCDTYFCLEDRSSGTDVQPEEGKISWRKFMESAGLEGAGDDWATKS